MSQQTMRNFMLWNKHDIKSRGRGERLLQHKTAPISKNHPSKARDGIFWNSQLRSFQWGPHDIASQFLRLILQNLFAIWHDFSSSREAKKILMLNWFLQDVQRANLVIEFPKQCIETCITKARIGQGFSLGLNPLYVAQQFIAQHNCLQAYRARGGFAMLNILVI